jgi:mono/diheme cytochrome c family protein
VLLALTTYQLALLCVAAVFIAFALIVALVVPRRHPDFPGRRLGIFLAICIALFAAQLTAVIVLAQAGEEDEPATEAAPTETTTTETTATETTTTEPTTTTEAAGDPVAGKVVFTGASGCTGCHTLADAGATGTVGPNLDETTPSYDKAVERVTNGKGGMPSFSSSLSEQQIQDVAAYVSSVAGS